jgi:acetyltransferase-like isoleucine patch superfamily enzyme
MTELLFDRWNRADSLGFGEGSSVYHDVYVYGDVIVGAGCWIGPWVMLDGSGGQIEIGDGCTIGAGSHIYTHDNVLETVSGGTMDKRRGSVSVAHHTYVGAKAVVLCGVTIGERAVIGASSVVTADVPDRSVVFGVPARVRGHVLIDEAGHAEIRLDHSS